MKNFALLQPKRRTAEGQAAARAQAETKQLEDLRAQLEASRKQLQEQKSTLQQVRPLSMMGAYVTR